MSIQKIHCELESHGALGRIFSSRLGSSKAAVPELFDTRDQFVEDNFSTDRGWGVGVVQVGMQVMGGGR